MTVPKVKFVPQNVEFELEPNETVLELSRRAGVTIKSVCNGVPSCAECRVRVIEGTHNLLPPSFKEKNLIGTAYFVDGSRLSCQLKPLGDITVSLEEQIAKQNEKPIEKKPQLPRKYQLMKELREAEADRAPRKPTTQTPAKGGGNDGSGGKN